jgi:hypothetical protein
MKKLSVAKQVLNLLNTQGGKKPKQIIAETKASAGSVYNALNQLRSRKMVAKEEDGVYISQTQTSVSDVTNKVTKRGRPTRVDMLNIQYVKNLEKENKQLTEWTQMWKRKYEVLERDYTQAKVMYLNSQAVVAYLEEKVVTLLGGK